MKNNLPVTNTEVMFDESQFMLTKTDLKGVITYANRDFIKVSGFSEEELLGSSHNIVRHPDMPVEAFKDMWENLKAGKPWTGLVKNRTKNGDFYWVEANATPVMENDQVTGYLSARRKPTRQQVEAATSAYKLFKDGQAKGLTILDGKVVKDSILNKLKTKLGNIKVTHKILGLALFSTAIVFIQAAIGLFQLSQISTSQASSQVQTLTFAGVALAVILLIWMAMIVSRSITQPLKKSINAFGQIVKGNYSSAIDASGTDELSEVLQELKKMQTLLSVNENTLKENAIATIEQSTLFENQLAAISNSTGVIEFTMDGKVTKVNDIFLNVIGYRRDEVLGQHHSIFVEPEYRTSPEYKAFWEGLNQGKSLSAQFPRLAKGNKEVWLEASYNPILNTDGKPYKVVKYATDITTLKLKNADFEGQITAIGKSQGVIEVSLDGIITKVNQVYLEMLGYKENELLGQHVSLVLDPTFAKSAAYKELWNKLVNGGTDAGQYKRIAKDGREVWIQASYNPIYDLKGKPSKIVNYTINITDAKLLAADNEGQISGIKKTQGVIEFDLSGKVISVNDIFANISGYSESEILGKPHSMFVEPSYHHSYEYKAFWEALGRGEAQVGQFKRIGKGGMVVWMQAIYNPILDMNGKPFKIVKYATDITEQRNNAENLQNAVEETKLIIENAKAGNLSNRVSLEGKSGAIASLCDGVNELMDKMTEIISQVREASETINTAAGEISSGNNDLSSRTEQQASSLEETAASMEELAAAVKNNAENAKQANQLAAAASGVAIQGGQVVDKVVSTMTSINESAIKIEDIISVIDGIAFQTNILALNAAVEAARAGEQGRGFAVVAGEVRNLAQRSASAAKEIKELITDSVNKTAEGTVLVENAGKTMKEIVSSVQRVTDIMAEITAASSEQSTGIDQVNQAITSMDEVTQQNAALVEEAAAAAESLVEQASNLMETVSAFKLASGLTSHGQVRGLGNTVKSNVSTNNRRSSSSPMRMQSSSAKTLASKPIAKTGTDDETWEEF